MKSTQFESQNEWFGFIARIKLNNGNNASLISETTIKTKENVECIIRSKDWESGIEEITEIIFD
jgi:hypothetical protein